MYIYLLLCRYSNVLKFLLPYDSHRKITVPYLHRAILCRLPCSYKDRYCNHEREEEIGQ